ncbi:hypothetical protein ACFV90_36620 [Streptomyces sp. NPDC059904]|uniref:hypothetical protein n=1 Tax=Streptomyces sp. NPDC059904 TaxID=3346996 RepID=UPI00366541EA
MTEEESFEIPTCPRCEGPLDPGKSMSKTKGGAMICIPCENDETVHHWTHQPLPEPHYWPVPRHLHMCKDGDAWPLHVLMGGGNPFLYLWKKERQQQAKTV